MSGAEKFGSMRSWQIDGDAPPGFLIAFSHKAYETAFCDIFS